MTSVDVNKLSIVNALKITREKFVLNKLVLLLIALKENIYHGDHGLFQKVVEKSQTLGFRLGLEGDLEDSWKKKFAQAGQFYDCVS